MALCQGFLCGACLSASNKLDMTVFNEWWARGNWDAIVHVVADKGYDCSSVRDLIKKQGKIPVIPSRGPFVPACQIESAIKHVTPSSDSLPISKNINALLHAPKRWMQPSSLFFALACLNVFNVFC